MVLVACMFAHLAGLVCGQSARPLYLGVLEAGGLGTVRNNENALSRPDVRVAFRFENGGWMAMPHEAAYPQALESLISAYPETVSWLLALDGRRVGSVKGDRPGKFGRYSEVGIQFLAIRETFPRIRAGRKAFYVWGGTPGFRPLVAISRPNYADPDHWKPFHPTPDIARQAYSLFRALIGIPLDCKSEILRHDYPDELIRTVGKAYRSAKGDILLELGTSHTCDPNGVGEDWQDPIYFLLRSGAVTYVGKNLTLVDAGDYDRDGTSEVVFQYSGDNRDGYLLLHNHLTSVAEFTWNYH